MCRVVDSPERVHVDLHCIQYTEIEKYRYDDRTY